MRARFTTLAIMLLLLSVTMLITGQSVADPSPQCVVVGRSAQGPAGEIQCRENALKSAAARQQPAMLFWLARAYGSIGEAKAEENYRKIVTNHCASSPSLCELAKKELKDLASQGGPIAIQTPFTPSPYSFAISADGNRLVYVATVKGKTALYQRHVDSGVEIIIPGTDSPGYPRNGASPFWSPDGKSIGYFHDGKLKRIDVDGRNAKPLAEAPDAYGGSWSTNGTIVFVPRNNSSVFSVRADGDGSDVKPVTPTTATSQRYPQFLPDGTHFLFYWFRTGIAVGSLNGDEPFRVGITSELARFVSPDQLLFERGGQVFAQQLDMQSFKPQGSAARIVERVAMSGVNFAPGNVALATSASGAIAYRTNTTVLRQLVWYDRQGRRGPTIGRAEATDGVPRISPDSTTVAVRRGGGFGFFDIVTGEYTTRSARVWGPLGGPAFVSPVWSPAGDAIAFSFVTLTPRGGIVDLYQQSMNDSTWATNITRADGEEVMMDWSPNGFVLFRLGGESGDGRLYVQSATGSGERIAVADSATAGEFSPDRDGRWIAYQTASGDRSEVYVQPFHGSSSQRQQVSLNGGHGPHWSHDGQELYFLSPDNQLMVVSIRAEGDNVKVGQARPLFEQPLTDGATFAPTADGRFVVHEITLPAPPIYVQKDWTRSTVEPNTPLR